MTETTFTATPTPRPSLPEPQRERWQPLRLGLIELFQYDSEEFWFRDGHLLLRGNNGTGKSKVLSLTLPFLFDANLRPSRIEPDGDSGKKMAWNLLMGAYPRRIGYAWIEFGRRTADGMLRYLTLGAGLSAVTGKTQVESWYFVVEGDAAGGDARIGHDLWLTNDQRVVLTRDRLRETLEAKGSGKVFENAQTYRRAVDERLFQLGPKRYDALIDTLIQLRQPQLSKKPDEAGLSHALTEALPPMPSELLTDVAEALNQLEEDRLQLDRTRQLERAVKHFEQRYRIYAGTSTRRQARDLRQAQTGYDNASEARNAAHKSLSDARDAELEATTLHAEAKRLLAATRERLQTLQSDPANGDANRLNVAKLDADERKGEALAAAALSGEARQRLMREQERSRLTTRRFDAAKQDLASARASCTTEAARAGTSTALAENPLTALPPEQLANPSAINLQSAVATLRDATSTRRASIRHLEQRHNAVAAKLAALQSLQSAQRDQQAALEDAAALRAEADLNAETAGNDLLQAWTRHCDGLVQLRVDAAQPLEHLIDWVARPEGPNPQHAVLAQAFKDAMLALAQRETTLLSRQAGLQEERLAHSTEREQLAAGRDPMPPQSATRDPDARNGRIGAPLWQLVDFQPQLEPRERAGVEAALEAAQLLDAWLAPDGGLTRSDGTPVLDGSWVQRPPVPGPSLASALQPAVPENCGISSSLVSAVLAGTAFGPKEVDSAETWISAGGRYRLGPLAGAWHKAEAVYIGHTARARARQRRLEAIAQRLVAIEAEDLELRAKIDVLNDDRVQAQREWAEAPLDDPLRAAIQAVAVAEQAVLKARSRLDGIDAQCRSAEDSLETARTALATDAADLQLPLDATRLPELVEALDRFSEAYQRLTQAAREWQVACSDYLAQQERESDAHQTLGQREEALLEVNERAERAATRYETLKRSIGGKVDALLRQLSAVEAEVGERVITFDDCQSKLTKAGEARAVAATRAQTTDEQLAERGHARAQAIERLQHFAASSLLASALPDIVIPDISHPWTIDPALGLARRAEQALTHVVDDDVTWGRIQRQVSEDLAELHRSLNALGHQAAAEPNDWGFAVHILYQNRSERPDTLAALLADDIAQRSELLSSKEREVLENHLQAEIAAEIQRLMRAADLQVDAINEELRKRPTSTGVRYRLQWVPLTPEEGAPSGLEIARERLLKSSSDMWSAEDRRVVGVMLQQQITLERAAADADVSALGSSMTDQLARALDYRRWHRFRVERQHRQGEPWRKLSGPASSGERALGLTVPLFAAISSFYGRGGSPNAPRLMLLDEAFAGIDDAARAHCMGLIREFDLDFVITSEREWACYAELPGVSICQLQRREGLDAVFVSRWTWDGTAKRREDDPDRRFPSP
jgi:uncharacterized protein (TIGR02680 family)